MGFWLNGFGALHFWALMSFFLNHVMKPKLLNSIQSWNDNLCQIGTIHIHSCSWSALINTGDLNFLHFSGYVTFRFSSPLAMCLSQSALACNIWHLDGITIFECWSSDVIHYIAFHRFSHCSYAQRRITSTVLLEYLSPHYRIRHPCPRHPQRIQGARHLATWKEVEISLHNCNICFRWHCFVIGSHNLGCSLEEEV